MFMSDMTRQSTEDLLATDFELVGISSRLLLGSPSLLRLAVTQLCKLLAGEHLILVYPLFNISLGDGRASEILLDLCAILTWLYR